MALAIRFDQLIRDGTVADCAELARLGHVSRARVTQIMRLLDLAPDVQEAILFLEREPGRERVTERSSRKVVAEVDWGRQRCVFRTLYRQSTSRSTPEARVAVVPCWAMDEPVPHFANGLVALPERWAEVSSSTGALSGVAGACGLVATFSDAEVFFPGRTTITLPSPSQ